MFAKFLKKYNLLELVFVLIVIPGTMAIFQADTTLNPILESSNMLRVGLSYILIIYCFLVVVRRTVYNEQMQLMAVILMWWFLSVFHVAPGANIPWNFLGLMLLIIYSYFRPDERLKIYELYRKYIVVMSAGGILAYLFYLTKIPFPCSVVPYYTGEQIQGHIYAWGWYYNYYIGALNVMGPLARLCGWFNEPGYFGTIAAFVLTIENLNLKRRGNILILIGVVFTFSMAAFVILFGYMITMALRKGKSAVWLIIFAMVVGIGIPIIFKDNPTLQYFMDRFEIENGEIKADNRTNSNIFKRLQKRQFESAEMTLFGYGNGALQKYGTLGILGLKVQLYLYGVVGILLTYGLLFLIAWKLTKGSYQAKAFVIWFFLSTYQRPYIFSGDYMLLLFGGIAFIQSRYGKKKAQGNKAENTKSDKIRMIGSKDHITV